MKVLLDENFPLGLVRTLHADGVAADHIITLGMRGATDDQIRERLQDEGVLFLTQDEDFLFGESVPAIVVLSRVRQARRLAERIDVCRTVAAHEHGTPVSQSDSPPSSAPTREVVSVAYGDGACPVSFPRPWLTATVTQSAA